MTATVETVVEQLDLAPIILTERIIPTIARAVTLPDSEMGMLISLMEDSSKIFLAIFRNEIATIPTPSTSEEGEVGMVTFLVLEVPDCKSAMLLIFTTSRMLHRMNNTSATREYAAAAHSL